ncbi:uncharacterized protein LOC134222869 [Armigeres subalbatus]|uniref:uncharacterized protein LOC134222869 n=1 Tax=Armigeres subalbatus TaxID=124917 RepID=UPI002ED18E21
MADYDPPPGTAYDPACPLDSDDEQIGADDFTSNPLATSASNYSNNGNERSTASTKRSVLSTQQIPLKRAKKTRWSGPVQCVTPIQRPAQVQYPTPVPYPIAPIQNIAALVQYPATRAHPAAPIQYPAAPAQYTAAQAQYPAAPAQYPAAPAQYPAAPVQCPAAPAQYPAAPAQYPAAPAQYPAAPAQYPAAPAQYPAAPAQYPAAPAQYPAAPAQYPAAPVQYPAAPVQCPAAPVQYPAAPFQCPTSVQFPAPVQSPASNPPEEVFCARAYSRTDLYPTELDPKCYPAWTLSPYWPIYVSNFRLNSLDMADRNAQISTYFASKGLLSRMIYIRENDDPFFETHQSKTLLLDMLVYFTSKEDAERAIRCCDKTTYYGHVLNVYPGRSPEYFDPSRTVRFQIPEEYSVEHTETPTELGFKCRGPGNISTIVKHSVTELFVEFEDEYSMNLAVTQCLLWIPSRPGPRLVRKQRFLEQDCKYEMMFFIQQNSGFIDQLPPENVLQCLLSGKLPRVQNDWDGWTFPRELPDATRDSIYRDKMRRKQDLKDKNAETDELPESHIEKVTRQKEIFFYSNIQPVQMPLKKKNFSVNRDAVYRERMKKVDEKQKSFEQKLNMIVMPQNSMSCETTLTQNQRVTPLTKARNAFGSADKKERLFEKKKKLFLTKKKQLLTQEELPTLAFRNKLFFELLILERFLGKLKGQIKGLQFDELRTGVIPAIINTGLRASLSKYYTFPPTKLNLSDVQEPLDTLTPVFVSNFFVQDLDPKLRNQQIKNFFAAKDLSVYMVYLDEKDEFYNSYLKHVKLLDMLVYFSTIKEASQAIHCFKGSMHHGHKLSVFSGRKDIYFVPDRTVNLKLDGDPNVAEKAIEQFLSSADVPLEDLNIVMRYPGKALFTFAQKKQAKSIAQLGLSATLVTKPMPRRQRYTESDVKSDLLQRILHDAAFLEHQPTAVDELKGLFAVKSIDSEQIVWEGEYHKRKELNDQVSKVLIEWKKLQINRLKLS